MSEGLNYELRYGSTLHRRVRDALLARKRLARERRGSRIAQFAKLDDRMRFYIKETEADALRRNLREQGTPQYTTLVVPYTYAVALSAHTYWSSVFLSRSPVFQYMVRHGRTKGNVQAVEALIDYQVQAGRMMAPLYVWLYDAAKYGEGVVCSYWDRQELTVSEIVEVPETYLGVPIPGTKKKVRRIRRVRGYEGNRLFNVRPADFLPDPRVSLFDYQRGEFVGRMFSVGWHEVLEGAESGRFFNIEALKKVRTTARDPDRDTGGTTSALPSTGVESASAVTASGLASHLEDLRPVDMFEIHVRLVPKDWGLGSSPSLEMWRFTVAANEVIIEARPLGALHGHFPFFVLTYELDAYDTDSRGLVELLDPMNQALEWLLNTHFFNVRSALNNMLVVDPSRVVLKDLMDPRPGKIIRLKETAYGQPARDAVHQLQIADVTQGHLRDTQIVVELMQRISGVTDVVMGMADRGGRKTATEIRTSSTFGVNRLKSIAEWWSATGFSLLAQVLLQNTQQYYDEQLVLRVAGDLTTAQELQVTPEDIQGLYDFVPVDGTLPVDRFAQANLWREIFFNLAKVPALAEQFDMQKIFIWMAQLSGLKNINAFKVEVSPDAAVAQQQQGGDIVSLETLLRERNLAEPGQVSGVGATG